MTDNLHIYCELDEREAVWTIPFLLFMAFCFGCLVGFVGALLFL